MLFIDNVAVCWCLLILCLLMVFLFVEVGFFFGWCYCLLIMLLFVDEFFFLLMLFVGAVLVGVFSFVDDFLDCWCFLLDDVSFVVDFVCWSVSRWWFCLLVSVCIRFCLLIMLFVYVVFFDDAFVWWWWCCSMVLVLFFVKNKTIKVIHFKVVGKLFSKWGGFSSTGGYKFRKYT